jgi:hypothetical protein
LLGWRITFFSPVAESYEQGKLVFPKGKAFTPDSSVRINIVGHPEVLEQVGATKLADYTDQLARHYDNVVFVFTIAF